MLETQHIKPRNTDCLVEVALNWLPSCPALSRPQLSWAGSCLRRQSWGQTLASRLSTASQWPSGQVLMLGEQVEKFLLIPMTQWLVRALQECPPQAHYQSQEGSTLAPRKRSK